MILSIKNLLRSIYSALVTMLLTLVPIFKSCPPCPLCVPKYAAILSFFGIPLADYSHILTPIMLASMLLTVLSLAYQSRKYHFTAFATLIALGACLSIIFARFYLENIELSYMGMGILLVAIVKNQRDLNNRKKGCCSC